MSMLNALLRLPPREPAIGGETKVDAKEVREGGTNQAVRICSHLLEDEIWLILDNSFTPNDGLACYYAEEICYLRTKTAEQIREIHKVKWVFPGCRVVQEKSAR